MTFVPQQGRSGNTSVRRTALFWVLMIALATVLWQMDSKEGPGHGPARAISYSDFMSRVDQNNVAGVRLVLSPSTAELRGTLRKPAQNFKVTIPKEVIPDLTERLTRAFQLRWWSETTPTGSAWLLRGRRWSCFSYLGFSS